MFSKLNNSSFSNITPEQLGELQSLTVTMNMHEFTMFYLALMTFMDIVMSAGSRVPAQVKAEHMQNIKDQIDIARIVMPDPDDVIDLSSKYGKILVDGLEGINS